MVGGVGESGKGEEVPSSFSKFDGFFSPHLSYCGVAAYSVYLTLRGGLIPLFQDDQNLLAFGCGLMYLISVVCASASYFSLVFQNHPLVRPLTTNRTTSAEISIEASVLVSPQVSSTMESSYSQQDTRESEEIPIWIECPICQKEVYRRLEHCDFSQKCIDASSQSQKCFTLFYLYCAISLWISNLVLVPLLLQATGNIATWWSIRVLVVYLLQVILAVHMTSRCFLQLTFVILDVTLYEWAFLIKEYRTSPWERMGWWGETSKNEKDGEKESLQTFSAEKHHHWLVNWKKVFLFDPWDPRCWLP